MKRYYFLLAFAALGIALSCDRNEMEIKPISLEEDAYKVQIYGDIKQQPATRVTTDGFCTNDEVGVYIVNYEGETPGKLAVKGNQADNVKFTYNETGDWISEYDIFYKDNDTKVDFYSYYPYADPQSIEEYPHEIAKDQSKDAEHGQLATYEASDFLWAKKEKVIPTNAKIVLTFHHIMSSARVRLVQGEGWTDAAEFAAISKQVLVTSTIRKTNINLASGVVTPQGEAPLDGIIPMNDNGEYRAIVAPQTVPAGKELLVVTIDGTPRKLTRDVPTVYEPGKITTYDLNVSKSAATGTYQIEISGISTTAWVADNVSHGDDAREYVVVHNEIPGDLENTFVNRLEMDYTKIKNLKITGKLNQSDYYFMNNKMTSLQRLNLKEVDGSTINSYAFREKKSLSKCILPDKITTIGRGAFLLSGLAGTIIIPEGVTTIGGDVFSQTKITNVQFPSSLKTIGDDAFYGCSSLMCELVLPESIKRIEHGAFSFSAITGNLVLPDDLEYIEYDAFNGCGGLNGSLIIPNGIKTIEERTFYSCGFNGTLSLPNGLTSIGSSAFYNTRLKGELNIPETVTTIGSNAFSRTEFSGNLILPKDLTSLGSAAFMECWRLSGVVEIPSGIASIPSYLFSDCGNIQGIILHKDVEVIESNAFANCFYITSLTCKAKNPPTAAADSFNGVAKDNFTVEVPEASVNLYKNANNWREFKRIAAHREFSISRNLFRTLNASHSKTFVVHAASGENWSVESKPDWVEISPMSGTGKVDVTIKTTELARNSGNRFGEVVFLLNGKDYRTKMMVEQYDYLYGDGDIITLQEKSIGNGVNIVIMGDCFDAKDISEGKYLKALQDAYSYYFDIEPYLTYKDYFNVYGVFGMSPDSGMGTVNTIREARFGSQYTLNEGVSPDFNTTFSAACLAPINNDVSKALIIMMENSAEYSGLCYLWGDGSAVAVVPMSTDPAPYDFRGVLHHEAGGHGFGKLADEYIYYNSFIQNCPAECCVKTVNIMKSYGFYDNISLNGGFKEVPWVHMIYDPQFSNIVDVYEGAYMHTRGVFRSEPISCMNNNIPYYNTISREAMVKRIKKYAGESYSFEEFKALDKESLPSVTSRSGYIWDGEGASASLTQYPPKFMGEKPKFDKNAFKK